MNSHIVLLIVFSIFVSAVFAALGRDQPREQLRTGLLMFGGFIVAAVVLGWILFPLTL